MHFHADISAVWQGYWGLEPFHSQQHFFSDTDQYGKFFLEQLGYNSHLHQMILVIRDYLGWGNKMNLTRLTPNRLKTFMAIHAQLMEFFESVDDCMISSVDLKDCVKAQKGKQELWRKFHQALTSPFTNMPVHQL